MRVVPACGIAVTIVCLPGCGLGEKGLDLQKARRYLNAPVSRSYITQTLGLERSGGVLSGNGSSLWYPLTGPERGKRLVLRFAGSSLQHAAVMSAGPNGEFDVEDEVIFDRSQWKPPTASP